MIVVTFPFKESTLSWITFSEVESKALVASSKISSWDSLNNSLAINILCYDYGFCVLALLLFVCVWALFLFNLIVVDFVGWSLIFVGFSLILLLLLFVLVWGWFALAGPWNWRQAFRETCAK